MSLFSGIAGKNKDDIQRVWANKCLNKRKWVTVNFFRHQISIKKDLMHKVAFGFNKSELDTDISFNFSFSLCATRGHPSRHLMALTLTVEAARNRQVIMDIIIMA